MTAAPRAFGSVVCAAIALFLIASTWLPGRGGLQREQASITTIIAASNTWHEVELVTAGGTRIACRTRRGWPLFGPERCPLEAFERLLGRTVTVLHDGKRPYEATFGSEVVIDYAAHRRAQAVALVVAAMMLALAAFVWTRP